MQILVVVAATQANQLCSGKMVCAKADHFEKNKNPAGMIFVLFFFFEKKVQDSDGIIALRAEVEKVSGRAALDSG